MSRTSSPELLVLHAVRLLGFADATVIADRAGAGIGGTRDFLRRAEHQGWVQEFDFADLHGFSLTDEGRVENERQLARERADADPQHSIELAYHDFLPLNARLLRACTDWQLRPMADNRYGPNDHTDPAWDGRILDELDDLGDALGPLIGGLTTVLARFSGYDTRFAAALQQARSGHVDWVDRTSVDSCHRVWFQLHEDFIATLGIERGTESPR